MRWDGYDICRGLRGYAIGHVMNHVIIHDMSHVNITHVMGQIKGHSSRVT